MTGFFSPGILNVLSAEKTDQHGSTFTTATVRAANLSIFVVNHGQDLDEVLFAIVAEEFGAGHTEPPRGWNNERNSRTGSRETQPVFWPGEGLVPRQLVGNTIARKVKTLTREMRSGRGGCAGLKCRCTHPALALKSWTCAPVVES